MADLGKNKGLGTIGAELHRQINIAKEENKMNLYNKDLDDFTNQEIIDFFNLESIYLKSMKI
jgi:hypothetical protein